jgi:hypothetical protein
METGDRLGLALCRDFFNAVRFGRNVVPIAVIRAFKRDAED